MCASISGPFKYEKVVLRFIGFNSMEPLAASAFNLPKIQKVKIKLSFYIPDPKYSATDQHRVRPVSQRYRELSF